MKIKKKWFLPLGLSKVKTKQKIQVALDHGSCGLGEQPRGWWKPLWCGTEMLTDEVIFQSLKLTFADFLLYSDLSCDVSLEVIVTGRPHQTHTIVTSTIFLTTVFLLYYH